MSHRNVISQAEIVARILGVFVLMGRSAHGQEQANITFDLSETGELTLDWKTVLIGLLLALACCGLWRLFIRLLESRRAVISWPKARIWWPTAMLAWGLLMLAMFNKSESWGWAFDAILVVFGVLNFPALLVAAMILESLGQPTAWLRILVGSLAFWSAHYLLVRLAEWRAWINIPLSLHLANVESGPNELRQRH
jgi:hypothetical protein